MNFEKAKETAQSLGDKELELQLVDCQLRLKKANDEAKPLFDRARQLQSQGQEILDTVEDDRIAAHAIIQTQKERT